MEKLSHTTESIIDENVERLAALFPEVVTEVREPDGSLRHTIDVDALKERVGDFAEGQRERYQFTWPGKREAKQEAYRQIDKCLRPCPEESVDWDTTQNLYIEGDNLDALKLLRNTYAGKVKMIYIDPPYNTGHDFIYDDDFSKTKADYDAESGDYDEEGGRLVANPESNGRFHSDWCSMMYPRLLLARDLLSEDGVIFISIDDSEVELLDHILQEIYRPNNLIARFTVASNSSKNNARFASISHEYVLCYAKNKASIVTNWMVGRDSIEEYRQRIEMMKRDGASDEDIHKELCALVKYPKFYEFDHYTYVDARGVFRASDLTAPNSSNFYTILHPETKKPCKVGSRGWAYSQDAMKELLENNFILFGKDEATVPQLKNYLSDNEKTVPKSVLFFDAQVTTKWMKANKFGFDYPKPVSLVKYLLQAPQDRNALILDFFSGSATTAHAVMQLNAEDGGNRKFIMVQLPEACDKKSEAAKAGYKNICEIGKERIRRAGKKIAAETEESNRQLKLGEEPKKVPDIGFRVLKIDSSNFEDVSAEPGDFSQDAMLKFADNLKLDRTPDDLIIQVMLKKQIELSAPIEKLGIDGCTVFSVDNGRLVACFDRDVPVEVMTAMAKMEPDYAVMRDASFAGDDAVSNFAEIFKNYSSITEVEVI